MQQFASTRLLHSAITIMQTVYFLIRSIKQIFYSMSNPVKKIYHNVENGHFAVQGHTAGPALLNNELEIETKQKRKKCQKN